MPESFLGLPLDGGGKKMRSRQRVVGGNTVEEQYVLVGDERVVSYRGRAATFRTPGRAGTTGQTLLNIHNATGSAVLVEVETVTVDLYQTVIKAVTVPPPIIRLIRSSALPAGGSAITKGAFDTAQSSSASVTVTQDASADGTGSVTALANPAQVALLTQEFAPRMITAVGYEMADRMEFMGSSPEDPWLRPGEGITLRLDYTVATSNPVTDMWIAGLRWTEFTLP